MGRESLLLLGGEGASFVALIVGFLAVEPLEGGRES